MFFKQLRVAIAIIYTLWLALLRFLNFRKYIRGMTESKASEKLKEFTQSHKQVQKLISAALSRDEKIQPILQACSKKQKADTSDGNHMKLTATVQEIIADYKKGLSQAQALLKAITLAQTRDAAILELRTKVQRQADSVSERIQSLRSHLDHLQNQSASHSKVKSSVGDQAAKLVSRVAVRDADVRAKSALHEEKKGIAIAKAGNKVDSQYLASIRSEIVQPNGAALTLADVVGCDEAKQALLEAVILPLRRPDLFNGLRMPARGILLFGPPGNGKTLLARAIANEAGASLLNVSAATLVSKWVGDGEKLARALFEVAREQQPAVVFIDEIDSILRERSDADAESSRRLKTQLLVELDGAAAKQDGQEAVVVLAATNRPSELDTAALRRFTRRIYLRMPDCSTRESLLRALLKPEIRHSLDDLQVKRLAELTDGYSSSDLTALARDAAFAPLRALSAGELMQVQANELRPLTLRDFCDSLKTIRPSVPREQIETFEKWNKLYGTVNQN